MPDFTTEIHYTCMTNMEWSKQVPGSKGAVHTVTWDRFSHKNHSVQYDYSCTCESYKFGKGYCKHIKAVKEERCGWDGFMNGGKPVEINGEKCCPKCNGSVTPMKHAV